MNILPKKRWHVRTKDNIARVRRDEANAAKEETERQRRAQLAEQEARTSYLRQKANEKCTSVVPGSDEISSLVAIRPFEANEGHVSFISESEKDQKNWGANKEREEEVKQEKEKYEKSIGLLTYLGQSVLDSKGDRPWYSKPRIEIPSSYQKDDAVDTKSKSKNLFDPLIDMNKYLKMIAGPDDVESRKKPSVASVTRARQDPVIVSPAVGLGSLELWKSHSSKSKKSKKRKKKKKSKSNRRNRTDSSSDSSDGRSITVEVEAQKKLAILGRLRAERLIREREESEKAKKLIARLKGKSSNEKPTTSSPPRDGRQKYNSQFNPHLAKKPRLELEHEIHNLKKNS